MIIPLPPPEPLVDDVHRLGGKGRGLARLLRLGARVPPAFVVTPDADTRATDFREALDAALGALGDVALAVRSSGVVEDGDTASYAGIYETVLDVRGADAVLEAIERCRGSAHAERVRAYRAQRGLEDTEGGCVAVVVQRLVRADVAGVAFSADPVAGRRDRCIVEAVAGLGEALVSGRASPDRAVVDGAGRVLDRTRVAGCLDDALAAEVSARTLELEGALGYPVDVEWAVEGGVLWLLQVRPVTAPIPMLPSTATASTDAPRVVWTNTNAAELLPDVAHPLVFEAVQRYVRALLEPVLAPFGLDADRLRVVGLVGGRVYFNLNAVLSWVRSFPGLSRFDGPGFARLLGGDHALLTEAMASLRREDLPRPATSRTRALWGAAALSWAAMRARPQDMQASMEALRRANDHDAAVELTTLNAAALLRHINAVADTPFGHGPLKDLVIQAMAGLIHQTLLPRLTRRWLDDDNAVLGRRLLQGMGGLASAEAGLALWRLARLARTCGVVDALEGPFEDVRARLETSPEGRRFRQGFSAFLRLHGHHARGECDVSVPRWAEQPEYVLRLVRGMAQAQTSVAGDEAARAEARRALLDEVRRRLGPVRRALLLRVAERAAQGAATRETGKSEAMRRVFLLRLALLEAGRRAVEAGALTVPEDVFFLHFDELARVLDGVDHKAAVQERRRIHARQRTQDPPPVVMGALDETAARPTLTKPADGVLRGLPASPGIVEGRARVVLRADTASVVEPGEVLIAPFTDPGWTPYFLTASAVVMDFGGMLSHGSVIAREYGLPAVVNVGAATRLVQTGQRVRVNGDVGVVELLDPS